MKPTTKKKQPKSPAAKNKEIIKESDKGNGIRRIDRIPGLTMLIRRINTLQDIKIREKEIESMRRMVINHYIQGSFRLNGVSVPMDQLSVYLGMTLMQLVRLVNKRGKAAIGNENDAYLSLMSQVISLGLADRNLTEQQAMVVLASQGGEYKPFISMTANQAIQGQMNAMRNLMDLAKILKPANPNSTIINNTNQSATLIPGKHISTQEALKMMQDAGQTGLLNSTEKQTKLLEPYQEGLPEVIATRQQGFSMRDEGAMPSKKKKHDTRNDQVIDITED